MTKKNTTLVNIRKLFKLFKSILLKHLLIQLSNHSATDLQKSLQIKKVSFISLLKLFRLRNY